MIKRHGWKIVAGLAAIFLLWQGYSFTRGMFIDWAMRQAKKQYQAEIAELQARVDAGQARYDLLSENSAREREETRIRIEWEKRKADNAFAILRSETAEELRNRKATIDQVLAEKEKDEALLIDAKETIDTQYAEHQATLIAWKLSDERKDAAHAEIVAGLEMKYQTCARWTTVLEKRLKRSFWSRLGQYAKYGAAFGTGYTLGRTGK
jgi:hypothetical protein